MSADTLRDKIATVMYRHILFRALDQCECGASFDGFCGRALDAYAAHVADAVIAELGLYREGRESQTVTNEQGATYRIEGGHRYVTDWKADGDSVSDGYASAHPLRDLHQPAYCNRCGIPHDSPCKRPADV